MNRLRWISLLALLLSSPALFSQSSLVSIPSPDGKIEVKVWINERRQPLYSISYNRAEVLRGSRLGIVRKDGDFTKDLQMASSTPLSKVTDRYQLPVTKRKDPYYQGNTKTLRYTNGANQQMEIIFRVSNDGVAFRYMFPGKSYDVKTITEEVTSFFLPAGSKAWLQPMQAAKTGWEGTNPAYEEHYQQGINVGTPSPANAGWVFPALFNTGNTWLLITEAGLDANYCGSRLRHISPGGQYSIGFPDAREVMPNGNLLPQFKTPYETPWRVITVGGLHTIIESTLGTDMANAAVRMDKSFIKPGKSSWSWIMSKDDSIVYSEQKRYIDFAADMRWQYCLVDADWDRKIGYDKIKELAEYAAQKNVGLLLWYNSSGDWNTTKYSPKSMLLTKEAREKEFSRLRSMGIKGVKIDFFGGDGQSVIAYYLDILEDAAKHKLMVNFHGATLPRGWHRTYPHLMTAEAVKGFEMVTFNQSDANAQPNHCAMLPFTRNAFDPMDFTPMNLYRIPTRVTRQTTSAFELALAVVFISGIQHFAESPEGMTHVPDDVKNFLREVPATWDDVRFLDGYPGKFVVVARKSGNRWYVAGINGEKTEKPLQLDLSAFGKKQGIKISDGAEPLSFATEKFAVSQPVQLTMKPNGGFVMVLE